MQSIVKKTNLGIAVQEAIIELGLEREQNKIISYLAKAFQERYDEFKKGIGVNNGNLRGFYVVDNEFPIGQQDKQQYFRSIAFQAKLTGVSLTTITQGDKRPFTLIEGYSKNDDSKKRQHSKVHSKSQKKIMQKSGSKKQKKK